MGKLITYNKFLAYSENNSKGFYTEFSNGINLIHGKNTSGKSTLIQSIHYVFGINDEKHKLSEVLSEGVIFRLDFTIKDIIEEQVTIIRDDELIYIKRDNQPIRTFTGIGGNNSEEHSKLKKYIASLFGIELYLESSGSYKLASLEAMFLPYYVSQDYGWVIVLKSFRGLSFFKNFKYDYYDYYLGITNDYDRVLKQQLQKEKEQLSNEIEFLIKNERNNEDFQLSKLKDEVFLNKTNGYLEQYKTNKDELISLEKKYLDECNKLAYYEERLRILRKVKKALNKQNPMENDCPTCNQHLPSSIEDIYNYYQNYNDTESQLVELKEIVDTLKKTKGSINSLKENIDKKNKLVESDYYFLLRYNVDDISYQTWLNSKTNIQLLNNISKSIGDKTIELKGVEKKLEGFKTEEDIFKDRNNMDWKFQSTFKTYLTELGVKPFDDGKYYSLYKMGLFPKQGVELLKTLLAYYMSFNKLLAQTETNHRFPLMLDAIFKEDIDDANKGLILNFLNNHSPTDTQTIVSISDSKDNTITVSQYNEERFNGKANLILINDVHERSFLSKLNEDSEEIIEETITIINS